MWWPSWLPGLTPVVSFWRDVPAADPDAVAAIEREAVRVAELERDAREQDAQHAAVFAESSARLAEATTTVTVGASGIDWAAVSKEIRKELGRSPRRAYRVVDDFERELEHYTGAPHAVAVDSCTNALLLALVYERRRYREAAFAQTGLEVEPVVVLPRRTYVGVLQAARNAGWRVGWTDAAWRGSYRLEPTRVVDSARDLRRGMYEPGSLTCLSFHAAKQLPLGRGGAILTDDAAAAEWFRAARMDGRPPGSPIGETVFPGFHCPLPPDTAARGLWVLSRWVDSGFVPAPLPDDPYPDLSTLGET